MAVNILGDGIRAVVYRPSDGKFYVKALGPFPWCLNTGNFGQQFNMAIAMTFGGDTSSNANDKAFLITPNAALGSNGTFTPVIFRGSECVWYLNRPCGAQTPLLSAQLTAHKFSMLTDAQLGPVMQTGLVTCAWAPTKYQAGTQANLIPVIVVFLRSCPFFLLFSTLLFILVLLHTLILTCIPFCSPSFWLISSTVVIKSWDISAHQTDAFTSINQIWTRFTIALCRIPTFLSI